MIDIIFVIPIGLLIGGIGVRIYLFFDEKREEAARQAAYEEQVQAFVRDRISKVEQRVFKLEQLLKVVNEKV